MKIEISHTKLCKALRERIEELRTEPPVTSNREMTVTINLAAAQELQNVLDGILIGRYDADNAFDTHR